MMTTSNVYGNDLLGRIMRALFYIIAFIVCIWMAYLYPDNQKQRKIQDRIDNAFEVTSMLTYPYPIGGYGSLYTISGKSPRF